MGRTRDLSTIGALARAWAGSAVAVWACVALAPSVVRGQGGLGAAGGPGPDWGGAPAVPAGVSLEELVDRLGSAVYAQRESAMAQLRNRWGLRVAEIAQAMERPGLSAEQLVRLEQIAFEVYMRTPRGAMGVQFQNFNAQLNVDPEELRIVQVSDGFPAKNVLQPDDVILGIDGHEVQRRSLEGALRPRVISRDPGEVIQVTVRRSGERVTLPVELGSWETFDRNRALASGPLSDQDLAQGWQVRREGLPQAGVQLPVGELDSELASRSPGRQISRELAAGGFGKALGVDAGGEPSSKAGERTGMEGQLRWGQGRAAVVVRGQIDIRDQFWRNRGQPRNFIRDLEDPGLTDPASAKGVLMRLKNQLSELVAERRDVWQNLNNSVLAGGATTEASKRLLSRLDEEIMSLRTELAVVDARLRQIIEAEGDKR